MGLRAVWLNGRHVKDADKLIVARLKGQSAIVNSGTLEHAYPFCPRSDTPLIYKVLPSTTAANVRLIWAACGEEGGWDNGPCIPADGRRPFPAGS